MKIILSLILFVELIEFIFSQVPVWNLSNSAINLLFENSTSFKYTIYDNSDIGLNLIKVINKNSDEISQQNYIKFNNNIFNTTWEGIHNVYQIEGTTYVCPTGKNYLSEYNNNEFKELYESKLDSQDWDFTCIYLDNIKGIFLSYLHSKDKYIYTFRKGKEWEKHEMHDGYLDIIWPNNSNIKSRFYLFSIITTINSINLGIIEVNVNDKSVSMSMIELRDFKERLNKSYAYFDEQNYFYLITHNETHFYSGYSKTPIDKNLEGKQAFKIEIELNSNSPFEYFGIVKINYVKLIRYTKYAFYEINIKDKIYHGIIDVKLNKILFNSDENIKDFKPYSKNALLVVTNKSAYKLCTFALNEKGDDCIDQCPEGQSLILDPINNNHCGEENKCEKYLFKPMDYCIDKCNRTFYVIQNETICGLCKYINETHPYKIINQDDCINEKPNSTYFIDEEKKLLNYCDSSCETCFGEKDDQCLSCKNSDIPKDGKCSNKCPDGYYKDSNGACEQCDSNCLTCLGPSIDGNNKCLSCYSNKKESILIDVEGFPHNCVSECPACTILNENKTKCIKNEENYLLYIFIILIIIIFIVLGLIIIKKCRNKKKGDEQLITNINNEINENELKENRIVD